MIWLGLLLVASQLSAGCCCWRQHCAGWRLRHCCGGGGMSHGGAVYAGAMVGPACPSCYTPPEGPPVAFGGQVMPPGPPINGPYPIIPAPTVEPHRDSGAIPLPMPQKLGNGN
jgi:hypothetical protein